MFSRSSKLIWFAVLVLSVSAMSTPTQAELPAQPQVLPLELSFENGNPWVQPVNFVSSSNPACGEDCCDTSSSCCPQLSCCDDLLTRPTLTNYLFGKGLDLAENGILLDARYTNFYQGVTSGGGEQTFRNGNKLDLYVLADTGKMGLWEGGMFQIHAADWQFGQNSIQDAVGLAPVNVNLLTPEAESSFGLTNLMFLQQLGGGWVAQAGRFNALDLWSAFYPDYGRGIEGFMNVSSMLPLSVAPSLPFISNVAGVLKMGERGPQAAFVVMESLNSPTTVGLDFPNGVTMLGMGRLYSDFGGLPGHHTVLATYATGEYTSFNTSGWDFIPPGGVTPATKTGTWMATYLAEQRLWVDPCNDKRYTKMSGYVGFSDEENSPFQVTSALSIETFGAMNSRPHDRAGMAYFYSGLNDDFQNLFSRFNSVGDVHGGEIYYNMQVTPWFNLTFDLQAIEPAVKALDTAIVLGLRGSIKI